MNHFKHAILLLAGFWFILSGPARADNQASINADEQILKDAQVGVEGPQLLEFFRRLTPNAREEARILTLIRQLGSQVFRQREKASAELVKMGPGALPLLREVIETTKDLEVKRRARECIERLNKHSDPIVVAAAARLLAQRKPPEAATVLLAHVPFAEDEVLQEEIRKSLTAVAIREGKPEPVLVEGLTDKVPARRAAAAAALCRADLKELRPEVRKLLDDPEPMVRLRVAIALANLKEKDALPVLVELLATLPRKHIWQVEYLLFQVAGEKAPAVVLGKEEGSRQKYRDAWVAWWREHGEQLDLSRLDSITTMLGYTLLVLMDVGQIVELNRDGSTRWKIEGIGSPLDAEVIAGNRVLIAEFTAQLVTERTFNGDVVWKHTLQESPIRVQRLSNGQTFIATRKRLLRVDRAGKETVLYTSDQGRIISARAFRDGQIGCTFSGGKYIQFDPNGKEVKTLTITSGVQITSSLDVLPNGHLLVGDYGGGKIYEYDLQGKTVWQASQSRPLSAVRLLNGNTLVSSQDNVYTEFDRTGKLIHTHTVTGHPTQVRRR